METYEPLFTEIPTDRQECWDRLARFVKFWHGVDSLPVDCLQQVLETEARLHITLPEAFVQWHATFGQNLNLGCERAVTLPMDRVRIEDETLVVRTERVFNGMLEARWAIPLDDADQDDPMVVCLLGDRIHPCADRLSHFAIYCAAFDTINSWHTKDMPCDNEAPFPRDGKRMQFPPSFAVIKTAMYEGANWIALVSGSDWYLRRRSVAGGADQFVRHELRTDGLPP